jgi:CTP synthase (UTP-ammonia lyase)
VIPTDTITRVEVVAGFDGLWCVPASPYRSMDGALTAIRFARERSRPFLGTCGGFQHAVIEYARNVLGWPDAEHAETSPDAARPVINELECALVEATETVTLFPGTRIARRIPGRQRDRRLSLPLRPESRIHRQSHGRAAARHGVRCERRRPGGRARRSPVLRRYAVPA